MILTQRRKCDEEECEAPITLVKEFPETINLLDANANPLTGDLLEAVKEWRQQKVYCEEHKS